MKRSASSAALGGPIQWHPEPYGEKLGQEGALRSPRFLLVFLTYCAHQVEILTLGESEKPRVEGPEVEVIGSWRSQELTALQLSKTDFFDRRAHTFCAVSMTPGQSQTLPIANQV